MDETMKILKNKIKKWNFKQRLFEIHWRLKDLDARLMRDHDIAEPELEEALQIIEYWMSHMAGEVEKPEKKKRKKPVNLW